MFVSIDLQLGYQSQTIILVLFKENVLKEFRGSDRSVALVIFGTGDSLDTGNV